MTNGLFFPCLCSTTYFVRTGYHSYLLGLLGIPAISMGENGCVCQEVDMTPHLPSKLSQPLGAVFGCTESLRQIQPMGHEMIQNQCGCGETLPYRIPNMCLPSGGLRLGIQLPGLYCICFLLPLLQLWFYSSYSCPVLPSTHVPRTDAAFSPPDHVFPDH